MLPLALLSYILLTQSTTLYHLQNSIKRFSYSRKRFSCKPCQLRTTVITQEELTPFLPRPNFSWIPKIFTLCTYPILTLTPSQLNKYVIPRMIIFYCMVCTFRSIRSLNWFLSCSFIYSSFSGLYSAFPNFSYVFLLANKTVFLCRYHAKLGSEKVSIFPGDES